MAKKMARRAVVAIESAAQSEVNQSCATSKAYPCAFEVWKNGNWQKSATRFSNDADYTSFIEDATCRVEICNSKEDYISRLEYYGL